MIDMKGKVAVVFGLANKRSIAWAIAQKLSEAGASLAICYQSERLQRDAEELAAELPNTKTFRCDVSVEECVWQAGHRGSFGGVCAEHQEQCVEHGA
jgi:enoyl-[acyl-carrier protein] reductase I